MKATSTRTLLARSSLALVAAYFVAGLWPFDFRPANGVTWKADRPGLHFEPNAIAYVPGSDSPAWIRGSAPDTANFTAELWLKPDLSSTPDRLHILTIDDGRLPPDFALCQWNTEFLLRTTLPNQPPLPDMPEAGLSNAFATTNPQFITVTCGQAGTDFYLAGRLAAHAPEFHVDPAVLRGQMILGNNTSGKHSWVGDLYGLAIFNRALDARAVARDFALWTNGSGHQLVDEPGLTALYLFDEGRGSQAGDRSSNQRHLIIPAVYFVPHKEVLVPPWRDLAFELSHPSDIILNILGFVPFGFCFFLYRRLAGSQSRAVDALLVVASGFAISLAIELIQVWLPNRVSSATDLLCNTLGTLLGVMLALVRPLRRSGFREKAANETK